MSGVSVTRRFAQHIAQSEPGNDQRAIANARAGVLDFLAAAFAGADDSGAGALWTAIDAEGGSPAVSVIGKERRAGVLDAALVNGYIGHALDNDDTLGTLRGHPSTVVLPALFAIAEARRASARQLLEAYVVGVEAAGKAGQAIGHLHYELGFHNTATLGTIGAAAAAAFLLKLDAAAVANAVGLAATQSGGLRSQFGSRGKPLHAGVAARAGLLAALLAEAGFEGSPDALDGPNGFLQAFGGGASDPETALKSWGSPWQIVSPGLKFKAYPCCSATHSTADVLLQWHAQYGLAAERIESVTISFPPGGDAALVVKEPKTGYDGRFSIEYVVAASLADGKLGIDTFAAAPIRPDIARLLQRVERRIDATAVPVSVDPAARFTDIELRTTDGTVLSHRATSSSGSGDLRTKFADAAGGDDRLAFIPDWIDSMETAQDLARLTGSFRQVGRPAKVGTT